MPEDANMKKSAKSRRGFSSHVLALVIIVPHGRWRPARASALFADVELGPWYTSGPLKASSFAESFFPEQGVDLQAQSPEGQPRWRPRPDWADGQVHMLDGSERVSTYLSRTLKVPAALAVEASLGSDDGCELWLNGQKLLSHDVPRGPAPDQDRVTLKLKPGENRLLFKIHNNGGGHGFYFRIGQLDSRSPELRAVNLPALRRAVEDLNRTFASRYVRGAEYLKRLADLERRASEMELALAGGEGRAAEAAASLVRDAGQLRREALLDHPLLSFDRLLLVRRKANQLGLPQNWQGNCALPRNGYDNQIAVLSPVRPEGRVSTLYQPPKDEFVGDVDLHFDAGKMLFSMPGTERPLAGLGTGRRRIARQSAAGHVRRSAGRGQL